EPEAVWDLFWPLIVGATLVLPGTLSDHDSVAGLIREHQVTTAQLAPATLDALLRSSLADSCKSLRQVLCGKEVILDPFARAPGRRSGPSTPRSRGSPLTSKR